MDITNLPTKEDCIKAFKEICNKGQHLPEVATFRKDILDVTGNGIKLRIYQGYGAKTPRIIYYFNYKEQVNTIEFVLDQKEFDELKQHYSAT